MYVLHSIMAYSLCVPSKIISIAKVHGDYDFSSSDYSVFTIDKDPFIICIYWWIISYENITELYSILKIISYPIFEHYSGRY